jgi:hypothetical protein
MAIVAAMPSQTSDGEVRVLSMQVPYNKPPDTYSEELREKLVALMKILYFAYVFPKETLNSANVHVKFLKDLVSFAVADDSLFSQSLVALGTGFDKGTLLSEGTESSVSKRSQYLSFWVVGLMMCHGGSKIPGILQDLVTKHLAVHKSSQQVIDLLCRIRIAGSRERTRLSDIDTVNKKLMRGWDLNGSRYVVPFLTYDNLAFRIQGAKAGYDQYVMVIVMFITIM